MSRYRAEAEEREKWMALLISEGYSRRFDPIFDGPVAISIKLIFRGGRFPNEDNAITSLKPLIDCLEVHRVIPIGSDPRKWHTRGHAGFVLDDELFRWRGIELERSKARGPQTIITLEPII